MQVSHPKGFQEAKDIKSQLSNALVDIRIDQLGKLSGGRYWIERTFEDGKGIAGLTDYQARSWTGWHHHMTVLVIVECFSRGFS